MRQSLSELYSTVRKAAVGRGAPHGIAEDLADAVCWLDSLSFCLLYTSDAADE